MPRNDQGVSQDRYMLIPRTLIFITCGDKLLLLKGHQNKRLWANRYNGIGGHVERGEDVLEAARRELYEESGLIVPDLWLCCTAIVDASERVGIGIYICRGEVEEEGELSSPEGTLHWTPIGEIDRLPLVEDLPFLLPRILALKPGDPPLSALYSYDERDRLAVKFSGQA